MPERTPKTSARRLRLAALEDRTVPAGGFAASGYFTTDLGGADQARAVATDVVGRYHDLEGEAADMAVDLLMRKRVAVVIDVERVVSWDHRKLGGTY